ALLAWALGHRRIVAGAFTGLVTLSLGLFWLIGMDFFPTVDAGQLRLHVRCPAGTRLEETARPFPGADDAIRQTIPADATDVQIVGRDPRNLGIAEDLVRRIAAVPGAVDVRLQQVPRYPEFDVDVDRWMARQVGFTESNVAQSLLVSLSGTAQAQPNYWLNV